jgi:cell division protein ZipA
MMQANWSLVFNILMLGAVIFGIHRLIKSKRDKSGILDYQPPIREPAVAPAHDDIIAVRRVTNELEKEAPLQPTLQPDYQSPNERSTQKATEERRPNLGNDPASSLMMFLLAKENRQLAGYELLQTVLTAGLRFGEGHLFHRHQFPNGQGPVLCSLAAATSSGVFDLQNIGAFSVHGLCLFMQASGNSTIDAERFSIMLDTAKQLSEGLDAYLLDDRKNPLNDASLQRYYRLLNINEPCEQSPMV